MTKDRLSPLAHDLVSRLTAPPPDHPDFLGEDIEIDVTALSPDELGAIWRFVDRAAHGQEGRSEATPFNNPAWRDNRPAYAVATTIMREVHESRHWPRFTDEQMQDYLDRTPGRQLGWHRGLEAVAWRADRSAPLPDCAASELRRILGPIDSGMHGAGFSGNVQMRGQSQEDGLLLAHSLSPDGCSPEAAAVAQVYRQTCPEGRYTLLELEWLLAMPPAQLHAHQWSRTGLADGQEVLRSQLDEQMLSDAASHLEGIQRGEIPYQGYKAFLEADLSILERALRRAQRRAAPSFAGLAHTLLTLSSVAPDRKSKSLPSQTLACKVAECISLLPTPEGIESIRQAAALAINATVKRTMETRLQQAKTALGLRPDVVLAMAASGAPDKKTSALLAKLLQASYHTGLDFSLAEWREKLLDSEGGKDFSRALIWRADCGRDTAGVAFMAADGLDGLQFTDAFGAAVDVPLTARIRLWHPLHATPDERQSWRQRMRHLQIRQPLHQAYREHYTALPDELERPADADRSWASNRSDRLANLELSVQSLFGLARAEGWKAVETALERTLDDLLVRFELGDTLRSDMLGHTESGALSFWRTVGSRLQRVPIAQLPPVLFSEACRAADLLVSASAYAYRGDDDRGWVTAGEAGVHLMSEPLPRHGGPVHPQLRRERRLDQLAALPLADMLAMRRQVLQDIFASELASGSLLVEPRSATIGEFKVNLVTAGVHRSGEQIELKIPKPGSKGSKLSALPWMPHDEAMLAKLIVTVATLL